MKRYFEGFIMVAVLVALIGLMPTVVSAEDTSEFRSDFDNQIINTENIDGDFEYAEWEDGVSITRYNGSGGNVEIPNMLGGKRVLAITGDAFRSCSNLVTIKLPDYLIEIEYYTFQDCQNLTEITFPKSLRTIKWDAFLNCTGLTSYFVASDNPYFTSLNGLLCNKEGTVLIKCPYGLTTVTIPESITGIEQSAFVDCSHLTTIDLPNSLTTIGEGAFTGCSSLKSIKIPDDIATIGNDTFLGCKALENIELPDKLTNIADTAFQGCENLTEINLPKNVKTVYPRAFWGCSSLTRITASSDNPNFTSISGLLCNKEGTKLIICPNGLKTVTIPESITNIGERAFSGNSKLDKLIIPKNVVAIEFDAFGGCRNLTSIDIPESITKIDDYTFSGCISLTSINLPEVVHIKTGAFQYCPKLKTINMPKVILIEAWTFSSCESLKNIIIPESTTLLDFRAFIYTELETIQFPSSTTPIDDDKLTIPETATIIGYDPSTAKAYASKYNRKFKLIGERAELESIMISSPAQKLNYTINEPLDITGLIVTGIYSDGSIKTEAINEQNVSGFDSSKVAENQLLTITINGKTTTYTIQVGASDTGVNCLYQTHVQDVGWQNWKSNGGISGTEGRSLRLEGIAIKLDKTGYDLGISYQTHIQDIGWEAATPSGWKSNGLMSGTEGRSLRLEAIQIKLTETDADRFDVYYQVHAENVGWMGWAKNGESAGTAGFGYRLEGIRIKVVPKDAPAPGVTDKPFIQN